MHKRGFRFLGDVAEGSLPAASPQRDAPCPRLLVATRPNRRLGPDPSDRSSIAVLPFENMSCEPDQDYFADGLTEDIITGLSRQPWFSVIARNSSFTYKGHAVDVRDVAAQLGVICPRRKRA